MRAVLPCVYYVHGGAMAYLSCTYGNYRAWARLIAARGAAVVMVDYRNCVAPSSVPEVAPYPAGLDDCAAGLEWVVDHASELSVDASRVVVSGESGGGNLTLALGMRLAREDRSLAAGLYAFSPFIAGAWPDDRYPSSSELAELLSDVNTNRGRVGYGIAAFEARDPLAWPGFATRDELTDMPPTVVSVNELDPLRDEGVAFYRLLLAAGVRGARSNRARHYACDRAVPHRLPRNQPCRGGRPCRLRPRLDGPHVGPGTAGDRLLHRGAHRGDARALGEVGVPRARLPCRR